MKRQREDSNRDRKLTGIIRGFEHDLELEDDQFPTETKRRAYFDALRKIVDQMYRQQEIDDIGELSKNETEITFLFVMTSTRAAKALLLFGLGSLDGAYGPTQNEMNEFLIFLLTCAMHPLTFPPSFQEINVDKAVSFVNDTLAKFNSMKTNTILKAFRDYDCDADPGVTSDESMIPALVQTFLTDYCEYDDSDLKKDIFGSDDEGSEDEDNEDEDSEDEPNIEGVDD